MKKPASSFHTSLFTRFCFFPSIMDCHLRQNKAQIYVRHFLQFQINKYASLTYKRLVYNYFDGLAANATTAFTVTDFLYIRER
jgi:hypothetical protein